MHHEKVTASAVPSEIRHLHRLIINDKNKDINLEKSKESNYCLTPYIKEVNGQICDISKMELSDADIVKDITSENYFSNREAIQKLESQHYKTRMNEVYCYKRADIKTMVCTVVTLPKEVTDVNEQERFFNAAVSFLSDRYGTDNVVSAVIHNGDEQKNGLPHLHFYWIPVCKIDKSKLMAKKNHVKAMEQFEEKVSCNDKITKKDLQTLHPDFQKYLEDHHVQGRVLLKGEGSGTRINLSIQQLKEFTKKTGIVLNERIDMDRFMKILEENKQVRIIDKKLKQEIEKSKSLENENAQLRERVKTLEQQIEHQQTHTFNRPQNGFGQNRGWDRTRDEEVKY